MKRILMTILVITAVGALAPFATASPPEKDMAVADIPDKTKLLDAELLGKYIFVHDEQKKAHSEPCLYVYRYSQDPKGNPEVRPENLVVSFHCESVQRSKVNQLVLTYGVASGGLFELREIQFAGSLEGHRVP